MICDRLEAAIRSKQR